ncbi:MAG: hypothetical protein ACEY3D_04420 [Rickettsia sp.]|uniref:hypothetical protein n=1 Tax=Rickettsia sp. TaxID=789 RepID=UPI00397A7261
MNGGLCHSREALLRGAVKPTVSPRGLTTGSIKTIKNTNSMFNWIPWTSHGMTPSRFLEPCNNASFSQE